MSGKLAIEERRAQVWDMMVKGTPYGVIAKTLGVHRNTITNDIRMLREKHRKEVADLNVKEEIGDAVKKFDEIFKCAMVEYAEGGRAAERASFLEKAMNALNKKVALLVETGVIPRAVQEITGKVLVEGVDVSKASLEELKSIQNRLASQLMSARSRN